MNNEQDQELENELDNKQENTTDDNKTVDNNGNEEKTFTQTEMEEIITKRVAREKRATEKAVEQAEKLAKMNEEEKREYEFETLQNELAELKKKDAYYGLSKETSKMLTEHGIQADDEVLNLVVGEDAEGTKENVGAFVNLINRKVEEGVKQALAGQSPRVNTSNNNNVTKESIMAIKNNAERVKAISENTELFE